MIVRGASRKAAKGNDRVDAGTTREMDDAGEFVRPKRKQWRRKA